MLQGTNQYNELVLGFYAVLLVCVFSVNKEKVKLPSYYILAICIYACYLLIGVFNGHENPLVDIKFQIFSFLFFFSIVNLRFDYIKLLFLINNLVFVIYVLLYLNLIPNIWNEFTFGSGGRLYGPSIISINILLFCYLLEGKQFDRKLILAILQGGIYILLTTNFMNLAVFVVLAFLLAVNFRSLLKPIYIASIFIVLILGVVYLNSPYVPELVSAKMKYIYQPWEYPSLKTRLADFNQIVDKENFGFFKKIFGEGFGASSEIYRYNPIAVSLSRTFKFQEIDNGFYYIYHRGGWTLFLIFIMSHLYLFFKINFLKAKIAFFAFIFITCILSIHYFNYYFYLIIPFGILYKRDITNTI